MGDNRSDYSKGYDRGHGDDKKSCVEIFHQATGMTKSESEKSDAYQAGKEQGASDKKHGK